MIVPLLDTEVLLAINRDIRDLGIACYTGLAVSEFV